MPKKEEILEKNDKTKKEKISEQVAVLEKTKKTRNTKSAETKTAKKSASKKETAKTEKADKNEYKTTKKAKTTKTTVKNQDKEEKNKKSSVRKTTSKKVSEKLEETNTTKKHEEPIVENKKIDELSVIEKIKSFIAKIAAMQEEARKEAQIENEEKETKASKVAKTTPKVKEEKETKKMQYMLEYYDLPYRYNETVVKILAQTPKRMFVYWDISDGDREKYIKTFGEDFFEKTYPVLLLYNEDKKYIKEIPINDFANSWYIDIPDAKTKYSIQLGRKFKTYNEVVNINMQKVQENQIILHTDYLPFANSNVLEVPNDHVLLENLPRFIKFRNVKTNEERLKETKNIKNIYGKEYDVKEFYEEHYKDELSEGMFDMANPSSNLSSSSFK